MIEITLGRIPIAWSERGHVRLHMPARGETTTAAMSARAFPGAEIAQQAANPAPPRLGLCGGLRVASLMTAYAHDQNFPAIFNGY